MNIFKTIRNSKFSIFFSLLLLFTSCSQYENDDIEDSNLNKSSNVNFENRLLTDSEIEKIGINHNRYLAQLMNNAESINDVNNNFDAIMDADYNETINNNNLDAYLGSTQAMNAENLVDFVYVNEEYFNDHVELTNKLVALNNASDVESMREVEISARNSLSGIDLDMFLVNASVSINSLEFWESYSPSASPEDHGDWKKADGISAAIGFITLACVTAAIAVCAGTGGLIMPAVAVVAEVAGVGLGSALSSAQTYFGI